MYLLRGFYKAKIACFLLALYAYLKLQSEQNKSSTKHVLELGMASETINTSESAAENVQSLVTPENFEGIAADLTKSRADKALEAQQKVRQNQARSLLKIINDAGIEGAKLSGEVQLKAQKKYLDFIHVSNGYIYPHNKVFVVIVMLHFCFQIFRHTIWKENHKKQRRQMWVLMAIKLRD